MAVKKDPRTLELAEPFVSLFPVEPDVLELVKTSMRESGFDATKPILTWRDKGRTVVVDGHTYMLSRDRSTPITDASAPRST